MRRTITIAALAAAAVAVIVGVRFGAGRLDGVVAATVERYGSAVTGTDVEVGTVDVALTSARAELAGLTIANPEGYDSDYAVRIGHAAVALDAASLAGAVPVIRELTLDGAVINAEQRGNSINLTDIERHATAAPGDESREQGRIVIERFRLKDARVVLTADVLGEPEELPLRDVVVEGIGAATGGATYSQAAQLMLTPVLAAARTAAAERVRSAAAEAAREELRDETDEAKQRLEDRLSERVDELRDRR
jgi:hypothetical protein